MISNDIGSMRTTIVRRLLDRCAGCLRRRVGRGTVLTSGATLLIAAAVLAVGVTLMHMRREALDATLDNTEDLAAVLSEQTTRSVQAADLIVRDVQDYVAGLGLTTPEEFRRTLATKYVHELLRRYAARLPQADLVALIGADGFRVNNSQDWPIPYGYLTGRDYLRHFAAENDPGLFISEPVVSQATRVWTVFVGRRVNAADGTFLGIVHASIPVRVFADLYASIDLPHSHTFMLLRSDGTILIRYPDVVSRAGQKMPAKSPWYELVAAGGGNYESPGYFEDGARLVAVRPLRDYRLVVNVATRADVALVHWRGMAAIAVLGTAFAAGFLLLLLLLLRRNLQRVEQFASALQESETHLQERSHELATTLASMGQGLMMVDAQEIVAVCNERAADMLDLPPALIAERLPFTTIAGLHAGDGALAFVTETLRAPGPAPASASALARAPPRCDERRLPDGRIIEIRCVPLAAGGAVATFDDITARRHAEQQILFMARHDVLTRLPNRAAFVERLEQVVAQAGRGGLAAVLCLDLDHFKDVNDTLGHPVGDGLLRAVADRLGACVREVDFVARFGGDEFAVTQSDAARVEDVGLLATRIIETLSQPYELQGHQVLIGVSVGIALIPEDGVDADLLLKHADIALYRAKSDGRGMFRFFTPAMDVLLQERRQLEVDLQHALAFGEFELFYQPLIDLEGDRVCGFEALLRWNHPTRGLVEPEHFVHLTEETGLIDRLGEWVLREACREAAVWPDDVKLAVNLSPVQFRHHRLVGVVEAALREAGLPGERLDLEITEAVLLENSEEVLSTLHQLHALGVHISMDDFGTGYSSLSYLRSFPFDKIKIDQSFVRDLGANRDAQAIVRSIISLGIGLGVTITAEGVETEAELSCLRAEGCHEAQGFLFSRARPHDEIVALLKAQCDADTEEDSRITMVA
jgi:diguanylate cyclase (GGDEF)-like protein